MWTLSHGSLSHTRAGLCSRSGQVWHPCQPTPCPVARRPFSAAPARDRRGACRAAEQQEGSVSTSASPSLKELQHALQEAVASEDYAAAARLRDQIQEIEEDDPIASLNRRLEAAVQREQYEEAARLRDELRQAVAKAPDQSTVPTSSDTVTEGVRVQVQSFYVSQESSPERGLYFFAYSINISNEGDRTVMLRNRKWTITDGNGDEQEVSGPGVVGKQPILNPGQSFQYTSACPLKTPEGTMEGHYEFMRLKDNDGDWGDGFEAVIGRFGLNMDTRAKYW